MHESGFMEELDQKWILMGEDNWDDNCPTVAERQKPASLTLYNMAGVFILVGIGIVGGVGLIGIEVIYKKSQVKQQRQLDVARHAAERWKRLVEVRPQATQTEARAKKSKQQSTLKQRIEADETDEMRSDGAVAASAATTSAKEREALVNDVIETV